MQCPTATRTEHDYLGSVELPASALHGIHTERAIVNFPLARRSVRPELIHAYAAVKLACLRVNHALAAWPDAKFAALEQACLEMMHGSLDQRICVDALQGGAGTSTNMNVNEVIANRALILLGEPPGNYAVIDPLDDVNRHQSTNDTYPTALRVAAISSLRRLQQQVIVLQESFQRQERNFESIVKVGRTQLQDAVLTTLGREFSAYAEAFSRDRWRIYKCEERLRVHNLGGTAIGTGLGAPRQFIFRVGNELRTITGFGLARADNLIDATQNMDAFVEVSGIVKSLGSSLIKIANDLRLLASGPCAGFNEIALPARQCGSSIMPGKINPVIPEAVVQAAVRAISCDYEITTAASLGSLELNPFLPLLADALLTQIDLLHNACQIFASHCVDGITANAEQCRRYVDNATSTMTALVESLGYEQAQALGNRALQQNCSLREAVIASELLSAEQFDQLTSAEHVIRLGSA